MIESSKESAVLPAHDVTITVIYDNRVFTDMCEAAWGFSCLVSGAERCVLFDTGGDGEMLMRNMGRLGIDPDSIDVVVLSHAHWDHTGGLGHLLEANGAVTILSPEGFAGQAREIAAEGNVVTPFSQWR